MKKLILLSSVVIITCSGCASARQSAEIQTTFSDGRVVVENQRVLVRSWFSKSQLMGFNANSLTGKSRTGLKFSDMNTDAKIEETGEAIGTAMGEAFKKTIKP